MEKTCWIRFNPSQASSQTYTLPIRTEDCQSFTKIDFSRILRHMVQLGYQGAFALETLCVPSREYVLKNEGRAQQKIRGAIE